jgi:UDP-glucuronate 4-epimerase
MALFKFTQSILRDEPIPVYNNGKMMRDFTYIDDIVEGITRVIDTIPQNSEASTAPFQIYNIGNHKPVELRYYIETLEKCLGKKAHLQMLPMQAGDVPNTYADISHFENTMGKLPHTSIETGIARFVEWYKIYYQTEALTV